jgi:hypothetical protein
MNTASLNIPNYRCWHIRDYTTSNILYWCEDGLAATSYSREQLTCYTYAMFHVFGFVHIYLSVLVFFFFFCMQLFSHISDEHMVTSDDNLYSVLVSLSRPLTACLDACSRCRSDSAPFCFMPGFSSSIMTCIANRRDVCTTFMRYASNRSTSLRLGSTSLLFFFLKKTSLNFLSKWLRGSGMKWSEGTNDGGGTGGW